MNIKDNIIYFDSDNEFYEYCVVPELVPVQYIDSNGNEKYYTDFNFTPQYNNAVNNGMRFVIKDEDSQIYKHGCVSYRTISKDIQNLDPWFDDYD
jgi:hypothetical protein